jgi:hypothetical protein
VWSLGVILVNLTCGRNPWKRACFSDHTFRSYMRDPSFLQSILPVSDEISYILNRIFVLDPSQRMTLPELRDLIMACNQFTMSEQQLPPSPPSLPQDVPYHANSNMVLPEHISPVTLISPVPRQFAHSPAGMMPWLAMPLTPQLTQSSRSSGSNYSNESLMFPPSTVQQQPNPQTTQSPYASVPAVSAVPNKVATFSSQPQYVPVAWYTLPQQLTRMAGYFQSIQHHTIPQLQMR